MEGHDAKIDALSVKIGSFQETCNLVITKQVEDSIIEMERNVDGLVEFRVAEKFDELVKQDTEATVARIFDRVQGQLIRSTGGNAHGMISNPPQGWRSEKVATFHANGQFRSPQNEKCMCVCI